MTQTGTTEVTMLTSTTEVRRAVALIEESAKAGDFEQAHSLEDDMMIGVLEAIASGNAQAGYLAAEALKSREIDFPRPCA